VKYKHNLQMLLTINDGLVYRYWFYFYPTFRDRRTGISYKELGQEIMRKYFYDVPHGWFVESLETLCLSNGMGGVKVNLKDFDIKAHLEKALESADDVQAFYDDIFDKALAGNIGAGLSAR
jgi:hypothetical protein